MFVEMDNLEYRRALNFVLAVCCQLKYTTVARNGYSRILDEMWVHQWKSEIKQ